MWTGGGVPVRGTTISKRAKHEFMRCCETLVQPSNVVLYQGFSKIRLQ
jgi:hypothetical protein